MGQRLQAGALHPTEARQARPEEELSIAVQAPHAAVLHHRPRATAEVRPQVHPLPHEAAAQAHTQEEAGAAVARIPAEAGAAAEVHAQDSTGAEDTKLLTCYRT